MANDKYWLAARHQLLQIRARQHRRRVSQQALSDLQQACGGDSRERRRKALDDLQSLADQAATTTFQPRPDTAPYG